MLRKDEGAVIVVSEAESDRSVWKVDRPKILLVIDRSLAGQALFAPESLLVGCGREVEGQTHPSLSVNLFPCDKLFLYVRSARAHS